MINPWSLLYEELNGTMDKTYPVENNELNGEDIVINTGTGDTIFNVPSDVNDLDDDIKVQHLKLCQYCEIRTGGIDIPRETVSIQEIGGFVEKNINPSFIQSNIDTAVRIALNEQKSIPVKWIVLLPTIIIFSAIAAAILFQVIGNPPAVPNPVDVAGGG